MHINVLIVSKLFNMVSSSKKSAHKKKSFDQTKVQELGQISVCYLLLTNHHSTMCIVMWANIHAKIHLDPHQLSLKTMDMQLSNIQEVLTKTIKHLLNKLILQYLKTRHCKYFTLYKHYL